MEYNNVSRERGDSCRWSLCIPTHSRPASNPFDDQKGVRLTYNSPPSPISPIAYAAPIRRRPATSASQTMRTEARHKSWFKHDPVRTSSQLKTRQSRSSSFSTLKHSLTLSKNRPSIGSPTDFRKLTNTLSEPMPVRRRSFRPLELSIYVEPNGRLSPLPDFSTDDWELKIPGLDKPPQALLRRETVDNSQLSSGFTVPRKPLSTYSGFYERRGLVSEPSLPRFEEGSGSMLAHRRAEAEVSVSDLGTIDENRTPTLPASQMDDMASSASNSWSQRSSGYTVTEIRPQTSITRHVRTESSGRQAKGSLRRSKSNAVDEAIKELNSIVEEKRIKAKLSSVGSPPLSPTSHVPAIAPSMTVRARSETLTDIGSAFSTSITKPLTAGSSPSTASSRTFAQSPVPDLRNTITETSEHSTHSSATALPQMMAPVSKPLQSNISKTPTTRKERLSIWLRRVSNASSDVIPSQRFYQLSAKDIGVDIHADHTRSRASTDTISTFSSIGSSDTAYATPATTAVPSLSPASTFQETPRPSISKSAQYGRRLPKRGLSIDTTLSNGSRTVPPAYHELDQHPALVNGELTPSRIGVAC
ncbi:uncharacterized protein PV09_00862 [Verruconis gallopava]|uniref:Uncharacterized protein n=1 Tax=Verruconis gallopava TaxID=253628 RepID=A0A0D2AQL0_9PEZI|nr:uncharacterized protein PV09_00862 [Verruconis gallopava]KIW08948.1 hypothetical protein PV09_00862 [Verruconis gallopava]